MAQSRKHKSKRVGIIKGARVINTGAGGGEPKGRTMSLEQAQTRKRMMQAASHLSREDKRSDKKRAETIARITKRVHKGGGLKIVKRG